MTVCILVGDVRDRLAELPDRSVQCVVTSPPYFGLRDYGTAQWDGGDPECDHKGALKTTANGFNARYFGKDYHGEKQDEMRREIHRTSCPKCGATRIDQQIGLEPTLAEYVETLVAVFREVRRVLRDDGTLWLNLGDSYANDTKWGGSSGGKHVAALHGGSGIGRGKKDTGLKPKDLMMVPARVALALQDDGWYLRSDIVWHKPNPMPESVTDRPTSAHEHIFLLTRRSRYYYDADAIRERAGSGNDLGLLRGRSFFDGANVSAHAPSIRQRQAAGVDSRSAGSGFANCRNVWTIATQPYSGAHFAVFPTEIPRRCILAGTSEKGACPACGAPWVRCVEARSECVPQRVGGSKTQAGIYNDADRAGGFYPGRPQTLGWSPSCACEAGEPAPCVVLDPFAGAGTTLLVADQLGRDAIGIELNQDYAQLIERRLREDAPMFAEVVTAPMLAQGALL